MTKNLLLSWVALIVVLLGFLTFESANAQRTRICYTGCNRETCKNPTVKAQCKAQCAENLIKNCLRA